MRKCIGSLVAGIVLCVAFQSRAVEVEYAIDPAQSSLAISGSLLDEFAFQQTGGSTITSYSGIIRADRVGNTIDFILGTLLDAALQPFNQEPWTDGTPGSRPADYGRENNSGAVEAIRDLRLTLESDPPLTITGINLPANSILITVTDGEADWNYGLAFDEVDLSTKSAFIGTAAQPSTLEPLPGGGEKLTLRFNSGSVGYNTFLGASTFSFTGTIVATSVPEPGMIGLLAAGAPLLVRRRRM